MMGLKTFIFLSACIMYEKISIFFNMTYPSPVRAQQDCICHCCFLMEVRSSSLEISDAFIDPLTSCLFAYTRTSALDSSSLANILYNSSLIIGNLSLSVESITTITNCKRRYKNLIGTLFSYF